MVSFKGEYEHSLDNKGRVALPAKLRKALEDSVPRFVLTYGLDKCLYLYPHEHWVAFEERLSKLNSFRGNDRAAIRYFLRNAEDIELDGQNRISLPAKHQGFANVSDKVTFIGSGSHIEIWSPNELDILMDAWSTEDLQANVERVLGGETDELSR